VLPQSVMFPVAPLRSAMRAVAGLACGMRTDSCQTFATPPLPTWFAIVSRHERSKEGKVEERQSVSAKTAIKSFESANRIGIQAEGRELLMSAYVHSAVDVVLEVAGHEALNVHVVSAGGLQRRHGTVKWLIFIRYQATFVRPFRLSDSCMRSTSLLRCSKRGTISMAGALLASGSFLTRLPKVRCLLSMPFDP
jgi:hypothetical protein